MERCQGQQGTLEEGGQGEDGLSMELDPGCVRAACLEGGSGTHQVENRAQSWARLGDLTLEAPSALQTQRDSPFRQKKKRRGFLMT